MEAQNKNPLLKYGLSIPGEDPVESKDAYPRAFKSKELDAYKEEYFVKSGNNVFGVGGNWRI